MEADRRARSQSILRSILAFSIASTALHYTHNFVEIDSYPDGFVSGAVVATGQTAPSTAPKE